MQQLLRLYQFWLGVGLFVLALFLGWGLPMIIPASPHNGILITIAGVLVSAPFFIWAYVLYKRQTMKVEVRTDTMGISLIDTLTSMHEQMIHFKAVRLKQRINKKLFDDASPLLFDKLGLVKLDNWSNFKTRVRKRVKRRIPKSPEKRGHTGWYYKAISVATEIKRELCESKEWQIGDVLAVCEWMDNLHIGLGDLRDNDKKWRGLLDIVNPYLKDDKLRELIGKHLSYSYAYCNVSLFLSYSERLPNDHYLQLLHSALVGSRMSPHEIETELSKILKDIEY